VSERALRLFVALELPAEAVTVLEAFAGEAADPAVWRTVPAESLHVTLAFLGQTEASRVASVAEALDAAAGDRLAPRLAFAGPLLLPPSRPRVLTAALTDRDGTLGALQARVSSALAAIGAYAPERRAFRPHVTVARLRPRARAARSLEAAIAPLEFAGTAVTLFSSRTSPHGASYEPLSTIPLETGRKAD
jgi:2'-5' RNA ligase